MTWPFLTSNIMSHEYTGNYTCEKGVVLSEIAPINISQVMLVFFFSPFGDLFFFLFLSLKLT